MVHIMTWCRQEIKKNISTKDDHDNGQFAHKTVSDHLCRSELVD